MVLVTLLLLTTFLGPLVLWYVYWGHRSFSFVIWINSWLQGSNSRRIKEEIVPLLK
jgi:hypothetical protein